LNDLQTRFTRLWQRHSQEPLPGFANEIFSQLATMYGEEWRSYHNIGHISDCLGYFDDCCDQASNPDAMEMAIWFHDCIYEIGARNNEARSRDWFMEQTRGILDDKFRNRVSELIMDTCHRHQPDTEDGKLIADIDLTSFSLPWDQYIADGKNVQKELGNDKPGSDPSKKIGFLANLSKRDTVYFSPYYLENFEKSAQDNISTHLVQLKQEN